MRLFSRCGAFAVSMVVLSGCGSSKDDPSGSGGAGGVATGKGGAANPSSGGHSSGGNAGHPELFAHQRLGTRGSWGCGPRAEALEKQDHPVSEPARTALEEPAILPGMAGALPGPFLPEEPRPADPSLGCHGPVTVHAGPLVHMGERVNGRRGIPG